MKLIYLQWGYPHDAPIINAMEQAGLTVDTMPLIEAPGQGLAEKIRSSRGDIVFSINFFSHVSGICNGDGIPYCCWVLQLPNYDLYTQAVLNPCNYIGVCDSYLVEKLQQTGVSKAFFLPDAVELEVVSEMPLKKGICFNERHPSQSLNCEGMTMYGKGYLEAFVHSQRVLYGKYILEDGLLSRVHNEFMVHNPIPDDILPQMGDLYMADRYLAPVCTGWQQDILLQNFDSIVSVIYSDGDFPTCRARKHPFLNDADERKSIYAESEFTLVLAPHTLHNGIPRDTLEVIASGGFPICGLQKDYEYFFKNNENIACFTNAIEFQNTVARYGNDHKERERVRTATYQAVANGHTYRHRIASMLDMWGKL
jgi:spore maturation protein CgeB